MFRNGMMHVRLNRSWSSEHCIACTCSTVADLSCKHNRGVQMASFLRQNDVEQCAVAAVHAALLFLFRGDLPTGMCTANELVGPSSTLRDHEHEWMQVLYTPQMLCNPAQVFFTAENTDACHVCDQCNCAWVYRCCRPCHQIRSR